MKVPALFVTAREDERDLLVGHASGGDEHLAALFHAVELPARLGALAFHGTPRRPPASISFMLNPAMCALIGPGGQQPLALTEYRAAGADVTAWPGPGVHLRVHLSRGWDAHRRDQALCPRRRGSVQVTFRNTGRDWAQTPRPRRTPMTTSATHQTPTATDRSTLKTSLVVLALLSVLAEAWQFVTAGQLFPGDSALQAHQGGAIVLHVVSGLTLVVAFLASRKNLAPTWLWVLAGVVFALTFVQATTGGRQTLWIHVPGAMVVTVGSVWVLATAVGLGRRPTARG